MYGGVTWGDPRSANGRTCGDQCSNLPSYQGQCCYTTPTPAATPAPNGV
jgi:hypothetical protein